jgi:hypothetical protein
MQFVTSGAYKMVERMGTEQSWGGVSCLNAVTMRTHAIETILWLLFLIGSYFYMNIPQIANRFVQDASLRNDKIRKLPPNQWSVSIRVAIGWILFVAHFTLITHMLICKWNARILIYILQPCHLMLIFQCLALFCSAEFSSAVAVFTIPPMVGAYLAIAFPDTSGLDQLFEVEAYWAEHAVITIITPIFLLWRDGYSHKLLQFSYIFLGVWLLILYHWIVLESIDLLTLVNVDFMLCPTSAMKHAFRMVPQSLLWPSYRSTITLAVALVGWPLSYMYKFLIVLIGALPVGDARVKKLL